MLLSAVALSALLYTVFFSVIVVSINLLFIVLQEDLMELRQLEYFMITCEKGSFNQAAECLYTTQPNVSKVISSLEKELGRPLFERSSRGIHITPYGETVREYAQNILHNISLINSLTDHNQGKKFSLATYPSNMISRLLTDFYKEMGNSYIVEHLEGTVEEISNRVAQGNSSTSSSISCPTKS